MKVTRTGMTTVIAQAYAAYRRNSPVEETKAAVAAGLVMGEQGNNNWLMSGQQDPRQKQAPTPAAQVAEPAKTSIHSGSMVIARKGGTDILV